MILLATNRFFSVQAMAASENPLLNKAVVRDPTLFCTAFKRSRFYLFSKIEPDSCVYFSFDLLRREGGLINRHKQHRDSKADRDVFNEKPTREEATTASISSSNSKPAALPTSATLHTTLGDIQLTLYPHVAPKAVENFAGHAKSTYYEGVIFHRVIKKFMLQTGDPLGDGTGGESIFEGGKNFQDEVDKSVKFDRPYMLAMANAGKGTNTNGSQFFITTVPTPHLNMAHT
jgi:peptidylprolyl isomerase domain and WD repeat-containing protein 1